MAVFIGLSILPHNDLEFVDGGLRLVEDGEAIGQHARQHLKFWSGEWFLDKSAGVDWMFYAFSRRPSEKDIADGAVKECVAAVAGVTEIVEYESRYEPGDRGVLVDRLVIDTQFGEFTL
jgi:hypothetical protein